MPTYIAFADWTDQGARAVPASPRRLDAAKRQLEDGVLTLTLPKTAEAKPRRIAVG